MKFELTDKQADKIAQAMVNGGFCIGWFRTPTSKPMSVPYSMFKRVLIESFKGTTQSCWELDSELKHQMTTIINNTDDKGAK